MTTHTPLSLEAFKQMNYYAVEEYHLPIELMMENAGLQLARLVARSAKPGETVTIGCGNGNNGGGGLVCARRLAAWGYHVYLDLPTDITREIPVYQLERARAFGARYGRPASPAVWVDAYLGFSQKLPLRPNFRMAIHRANQSAAIKISLDIPTGISGPVPADIFHADQVLALAAHKKVLIDLPATTEIYLGDLGIPKAVYDKFDAAMPDFAGGQLIRIERT